MPPQGTNQTDQDPACATEGCGHPRHEHTNAQPPHDQGRCTAPECKCVGFSNAADVEAREMIDQSRDAFRRDQAQRQPQGDQASGGDARPTAGTGTGQPNQPAAPPPARAGAPQVQREGGPVTGV